jgi:hypothetical protein
MKKYSSANALMDNDRQKLVVWEELANEVDISIKDSLLAGFLGIIEKCSLAHQECKDCVKHRDCLEFWDEIA